MRAAFPNLKPSTATISLRLPASMLEGLKVLANKRDVPYQSLLKVFLAERIERELAPVREVFRALGGSGPFQDFGELTPGGPR